METLNYKGVFKGSPIQVHVYSLEEWKQTIYADGRTLAAYNSNDMNIHMIAKEELPEANASWEEILLHEIIHYMQHAQGCWGDLIPLGFKQIPKTRNFKEFYRPESWEYEAEAHWLMYHPELLGFKLELV